METPSVEKGLQLCRKRGLNIDLAVDLLLPLAAGLAPGLALADAALAGYAFHLARRQRRGRDHLFPDPSDRVVEIGTQIVV